MALGKTPETCAIDCAAELEQTLARVAVAYHMHHMTAVGPSWDECEHPLCDEVRCLLPAVRLARAPARRSVA